MSIASKEQSLTSNPSNIWHPGRVGLAVRVSSHRCLKVRVHMTVVVSVKYSMWGETLRNWPSTMELLSQVTFCWQERSQEMTCPRTPTSTRSSSISTKEKLMLGATRVSRIMELRVRAFLAGLTPSLAKRSWSLYRPRASKSTPIARIWSRSWLPLPWQMSLISLPDSSRETHFMVQEPGMWLWEITSRSFWARLRSLKMRRWTCSIALKVVTVQHRSREAPILCWAPRISKVKDQLQTMASRIGQALRSMSYSSK